MTAAGLQAQQTDPRLTGRELTSHRLIAFDGTLKDANGQARQETVESVRCRGGSEQPIPDLGRRGREESFVDADRATE